jgi:hypothetical protein
MIEVSRADEAYLTGGVQLAKDDGERHRVRSA